MTTSSLFPKELPEAARVAVSPTVQQRGDPARTQSLYRKYRPQTFDAAELVGQEHVVRTLRNAILLDRVAHAYLFCGPRGTGKTTTARLLAKAVNCLDPDPHCRPCNACDNCQAIGSGAATDVIEIDAASNRGIDDIRDLRERVKYAPTQLRTKFYIIDEAHQITGAAANAFLKTLEEPPSHTKFVLATTDPEELLPTIVSRCQRFDFRRIGVDAIIARLRDVAAAEGLAIEDEALGVIARHAGGSLRDALGLLDQLASYGDGHDALGRQVISADAARALLGVSRNERVETLVRALIDRDAAAALTAANAAVEAGEDVRQLNRQLVAYLRVLLHQRAGGSPDADERARELASRFELAELADLTRLFSEVDYKIRHSSYAHLPFEIALVEGVLRGDIAGSTRERPPTATSAGDTVPVRPPATALRDRVRGATALGGRAERTAVAASGGEAMSGEPAATQPAAEQAFGRADQVASRPSSITVEQLVDLWPRIRLDVKAINRRVEALLSSVDPVAVHGDEVILAAAYAFHRDRLNADEVRVVVERVISRLVGLPVRTSCVLRGEEPDTASADERVVRPSSRLSAADVPPKDDTPSPQDPDGAILAADAAGAAVDEQRVAAAKNIFDAEIIETPD